jgi:hypothetical protein
MDRISELVTIKMNTLVARETDNTLVSNCDARVSCAIMLMDESDVRLIVLLIHPFKRAYEED